MFFPGHFLFGIAWFLFTIVGRLFWLALIIAGSIFLVRYVRSRSQMRAPFAFYQAPYQPQGTPRPEQQLSAMEILRQRYARGEIDTATYEQMRERLQGPEMMQQQQ